VGTRPADLALDFSERELRDAGAVAGYESVEELAGRPAETPFEG